MEDDHGEDYMEDVKLDNEWEHHYRMVFEDNYGGVQWDLSIKKQVLLVGRKSRKRYVSFMRRSSKDVREG